ncbi:MAG: hypothetical protein M0Z51_13690, partial [Propionibacterium sp.]|nr:hypothetical protein [Propionibacterium sp.]
MFTAGTLTVSVSLSGITTIVLTGGDGAASFTVDLSGLSSGAGLVWQLDTIVQNLTVLGPSADAQMGAGNSDGSLALTSEAGEITFQSPTRSLLVDVGKQAATLVGSITTGGADLTVQGRQLTLADGSSIDTRGVQRTGDVTLRAVDSTDPQGTSASISAAGTSITGHKVSLSASATHSGTGSGGSSAAVDVRDSQVVADGDVLISSDSSLTAEGATFSSVINSSTTHLGGHSTIKAAGRATVTAHTTTIVTVVNTTGSANARLQRSTRATIDGTVDLSATSIDLSAHADGSLQVSGSGALDPTQGVTDLANQVALLLGSPTGIATASVTSRTRAALDMDAVVTANGADVNVSAASGLDTSVSTGGGTGRIGALAIDDATAAELADTATLLDAANLTITGSTSHHATVDASGGFAALVSTVTTSAGVGTGAPLTLDGDLTITADQQASDTSRGGLASMTITHHSASTFVDRAVTVTGDITVWSTGVSNSYTFTTSPLLSWARLDAALVDVVVAGTPGAQGPDLVVVGSPTVTMATSTVHTDLGVGSPLVAAGSIRLLSSIGGTAIATSSGGNVAVVNGGVVTLWQQSGSVGVGSPLTAGGDVTMYSGRAPPAAGQASTSDSPSSLNLVSSSALVRRSPSVTVSATGSVTTQDDSTLSIPSQAFPIPLPGSTLILAAVGGTLSYRDATLTFAPGSLRSDAWVSIGSHSASVPGLHAASDVFDFHAQDALTGAVIDTFAISPVLAIAVSPDAAGSAIYYLATDGSLQRLPTTYDAVAGTLTAHLPHFSSYLAGSPLDALVQAILPQLQAWAASIPSFPATYTLLSDVTLATGVTLTNVLLTLNSLTDNSGSYSLSLAISATLAISLTVGTVGLTAGGTFSTTYSVNASTLDAGGLTSLQASAFSVGVSSGGTTIAGISSATATISQSGTGDLTFSQTGVTLTLGTVTLSAGNLTVTSRASTGAIDFQFTGANATISGAGGISLTGASASFTSTGGLAVSGTLTITIGAQTLTGSASITSDGSATTINVTDLSVTLGTAVQSVAVTASGKLTLGATGVSGTVSGSVTATGLITATGTARVSIDTTVATPTATVLVALRGVSLFVGPSGGTAGLQISGATVGLMVESAGGAVNYALDAQGSMSLVGIPGVSSSGQLRARVNSFATAIDQTIAFADESGSVQLLFTDGSGSTPVETATGSTPFASYSGTGLTLTVLGQSMSADVTVTPTGSGVTVDLANLSFALTSQGTTVASFAQTSTSDSLTLDGTGATGSITGNLTLAVPGVSISGTIGLGITTSSVSFTASTANVTIAGQSVAVTRLTITQTTSGGATTTTLSLGGGHFTVSQGATDLLTVTGATGDLAITPAGVSGHLSASLASSAAALSFAATVSLDINTGAQAVGDLPAGPFLRITATGATVTIGSQVVTADLTMSRGVDAAGHTEVRVGIANASLSIGSGVLSLTGGTGALILTDAGVAASLSGTLALTLPGVGLSGSLQVQLNTTGADVTDSVTVGSTDVPVVVPAGSGSYLRLVGTGISLTVAGQQLTGDLALTDNGSGLTVALTNGSLSLGGGLVAVSDASASLTADTSGLTGSFTGTVALAIPGVTASGTVTVQVDTTAAATIPVKVGATDLTVSVSGVSLTGAIWFQEDTSGATPVYQVSFTAVTLTLGTFLTASIDGAIQISSAGLAGSLTVTPVITLPTPITVGVGTASIQVNTTAAPVTVNATDLPAGPYLRVELDTTTLAVGTLGSITGSFAFEQLSVTDNTTNTTNATTVVAFSDVTVSIGGTVGLYNGTGAVILTGTGIAGYISGTANASTSGLTMSGNVVLAANTTGQAVDASIQVGGTSVPVKFATGGSLLSLSVSNASLTIGDFVSIEGNVSFTDQSMTLGGTPQQVQVFAGTGLTVFLGDGPAYLSSGALNPLAKGVLLSDAMIGLISAGAGYALVASGTVSLIGIQGVTLAGTTSVRVNTTGDVISQTLTIAGSTDPGVVLDFPTTDQVTSFAVTGATVAFGPGSFTGDLSFSRTGTDVTASITNGAVDLGSAVSVTGISGTVLFGADGIAASLTVAHVTVAALGLDVAGSLDVNTTNAPVTSIDGTTVDLPAGPYLRASVTGASLSILGQTISADVTVERATAPDGSATVKIGLGNVSLTLGAGLGNAQTIGISQGTGLLVLTGAGVAGRVSGTVTVDFGSAFTLAGSLDLAINTTAAPVDTSLTVGGQTVSVSVPAGPYVAFAGTNLTLIVMGQTLTGDVMVEKSTPLTASGTPDSTQSTLRLAATNVALTIGGAQPVVQVTGGTALVVLTGDAVAGSISGTVAVAVPQVSVTGTLGVQFNTGTTAVDETFTVGAGTPQTLTISATQSVRVSGTGLVISVLGQSLSGDFTVARSGSPTPTIAVTMANVVLTLGGTTAAPLFTATQTSGGTFTLSGGAISGSIGVAITLAVPGVSLTGPVTITFDTSTGSFSVGGTGLALSVFGQTLSGSFQVDRAVDATGASVVRIGVTNATLNLGPTGTPVVTANSVTGAVIVGGTGVAGSLAATVSFAGGLPFSVSGTIQVQLNTGASAVDESVTVGTATIPINLPAGPYLRIAGTGLTLTVAGQSLQGDVGIEQTTSYGPDGIAGTLDDTTVVRVALANVSVHLGSGTSGLSLTGGSGAFIASAAGVAGQFSGTVSLTGVPGVSLSATITAAFNTTGAEVKNSLPIGSTVVTIDVPANTSFEVSGSSVSLSVGGLTLRGDITFTQGTGTVTAIVANGTLAFGSTASPLVSATGINGFLTTLGGATPGLYGELNAHVAFDASSVSLSSSVMLQINTTGTSQTVGLDTVTAGVRVVATNPTLVIGGLSVGAGTVSISRDAAGTTVTMSVTNLTLSLGSVVTITSGNAVSGSVIISPDGVAGVFSVGSLGSMFRLPGSLTGTVTLQLNTGTAAVSRPDLGIDLPAGPYLRVSLVNATLALTGGPSFSGSFQLTQDLAPDFAPTSTQTDSSVGAVTAFAVGDVTGDGVPDLVLGNASGATVFPGGNGTPIT